MRLEANIEVRDGFQSIGLRSGDRRGDTDGERRPAVELESDAAGDIHPIGKSDHAVRRGMAVIERIIDVNLDCGRNGADETLRTVSKYKVSDAQIVEQESHVVGIRWHVNRRESMEIKVARGPKETDERLEQRAVESIQRETGSAESRWPCRNRYHQTAREQIIHLPIFEQDHFDNN